MHILRTARGRPELHEFQKAGAHIHSGTLRHTWTVTLRDAVSRLSANLLNVFLPEGDSFTLNVIILCCRMTPVAGKSFPIGASDFLRGGLVYPDFLPLIRMKHLKGLLGDTMRLQEPRS